MTKRNTNDKTGTGLYLRVSPLADGGLSKVFRQRICIGEKHADLELGRHPSVGPKEAMDMAAANRHEVEEGRGPRD